MVWCSSQWQWQGHSVTPPTPSSPPTLTPSISFSVGTLHAPPHSQGTENLLFDGIKELVCFSLIKNRGRVHHKYTNIMTIINKNTWVFLDIKLYNLVCVARLKVVLKLSLLCVTDCQYWIVGGASLDFAQEIAPQYRGYSHRLPDGFLLCLLVKFMINSLSVIVCHWFS